MSRLLFITLTLLVHGLSSVAQPINNVGSEPEKFPLNLEALARMEAECTSVANEQLESLLGLKVDEASCRTLSDAARELDTLAQDRDLGDFDRALMAENLLYLSRNKALSRDGPDALLPEDVTYFGAGFILEYIGFGRSRCFLRVDSYPKGSEVHIDEEFKGYTFQRYVLSPGEYKVVVTNKSADLHCEKQLVIEEDREELVHCPEEP